MMFIVGLVFSWQTARQVQKTGSLFFNKYFCVLFLFQTLVLMPQAIYYYVAHPDWCWMYWADSRKVPLTLAALTYFSYYPSIFWWNITPLIKDSVYEKLFQEKRVQFVNLSRASVKEYDFGGRIGKDEVPEILLTPHVLIDVPVAKTHAYFKISGAIKNLFGLLPEGFKLFRYHAGKGMDDKGRIFLDIYRNFPPDVVVVDGTIACEGHGPCGTPKETNFIMTSNDAVSADFVLCEIMGYNENDVPYLKALKEDGCTKDFNLLGESLQNVRPEHWKHTNKLFGLHANFYRILWEHIRIK